MCERVPLHRAVFVYGNNYPGYDDDDQEKMHQGLEKQKHRQQWLILVKDFHYYE